VLEWQSASKMDHFQVIIKLSKELIKELKFNNYQ
jgi:hypothetical protein